MDRSISTATKNKLFGSAWKSDIKVLNDLKKNYPGIKNIEIYLPYVAYKQNMTSMLEFTYVDEDNHENLINSNLYSVFYALLFLREGFGKQTFGIELTTEAEVIPQLYSRKHEYYYEWNKNKLTIRRMLGTFSQNKIEKMIKGLMNEYKRFYLMYCKTN